MSTAPKLLAVDNVTKVFTIGGGFHRVRFRAVEGASFALNLTGSPRSSHWLEKAAAVRPP